MTRSSLLTTAALLLAASLTAGCGKGGEGGGRVAGAPVDLAMFPADAEFVLSVSLAELRKSALWKSSGMEQALTEDSDVLAVCGVEAFDALRGIRIGGRLDVNGQVVDGLVAVVDGVTEELVTGCWSKVATKRGKPFTTTKEDGLTILTDRGQSVAMAWPTPTTVLFSLNPDRAWVKARVARQGGVEARSPLGQLVSRVDPSAAIWFALAGKRAGSVLPGAFAEARGFVGAALLDDGLSIEATFRFDGADQVERARAQAVALVGQLRGALPAPLLTALEKATFAPAGGDLRVTLKLSVAEASALGEALGQLERR